MRPLPSIILLITLLSIICLSIFSCNETRKSLIDNCLDFKNTYGYVADACKGFTPNENSAPAVGNSWTFTEESQLEICNFDMSNTPCCASGEFSNNTVQDCYDIVFNNVKTQKVCIDGSIEPDYGDGSGCEVPTYTFKRVRKP